MICLAPASFFYVRFTSSAVTSTSGWAVQVDSKKRLSRTRESKRRILTKKEKLEKVIYRRIKNVTRIKSILKRRLGTKKKDILQ